MDGDSLQCPVCFLRFDDAERRPVDIGCGHTFCMACFRAHPQSFRNCPECRRPAVNPHVNIALLRMLSADSRSSSGQQQAPDRPSTANGSRPPGATTRPARRPQGSLNHAPSAPGFPLDQSALAGMDPGEWSCCNRTFLLLVATIIYTISPIDIIPDVIPVLGLMDDLGLWGWLMYTILTATLGKRHGGR